MIDVIRRVACLGFGIGALGVLVSMFPPVLEWEETVGLDWLFSTRGPVRPPDDVVVVAVARESADVFGLSTDLDEWPRSLHADLIDRLSAAGAAVIAFDIIFDNPRESSDDRALAEAVERAGNVILLERVRIELQDDADPGGVWWEQRIPPIEPLQTAALATAPFTLPVVPIRVGQFWTFGRAAGDTPNLPAAALHAYALRVDHVLSKLLVDVRPDLATLLAEPHRGARTNLQDVMRELRGVLSADERLADEVRRRMAREVRDPEDRRLLEALIALYRGGDARYLNYYGPARTIRTIPYHRILSDSPSQIEADVAGKVVFVGFSERRQPEQQDAFFSVYSERSGQNISGVEIGATAFANLLDGSSVRPLPLSAHWLIVFAFGLLVAALAVPLPAVAALPATAAAGGLYAAALSWQFEAAGLWGPLVVPIALQLPAGVIGALLWNARRVRLQRERIQAALGYYLPAGVVNRLAHQSSSIHSDRELVFGTCLVTDAEQYTTLSEALHPEELGDLMSAYYQVLVDAVMKHGGIVSDIAGDSLVAVWPAAGSAGTTHLQACAASREILEAVDGFNRAYVRRELPTRIGLDSGPLLLGNIGSRARGEYRAIGDIVNTAARLQGLNRYLGTRVLLSGATANDAEGIVTRPLGRFLLAGKQTPLSVLELQHVGAAPTRERLSANRDFETALKLMIDSRWSEAASAFGSVLDRFPEDGPSRFFIVQCRTLAEAHPAGGWDGVVRMSVK